jgi:pyruvate formate lyase activating enzyme
VKEAKYYIEEPGGKVTCLLCPHECVIVNGKTGVCGVRKNVDGKLVSAVYSRAISVNIDPIEKKPLYHFYPGSEILSFGTVGCNLSCSFCQNFDISQADEFSPIAQSASHYSPEDIVNLCRKYNLKFLAFTYNEPTVFYEYMLDTAKLAKQQGIHTVVVSNGQINPEPLKELIEYIDAFNIDLKSFNEDFYKKICKGYLQTTLDTIRIISEYKKHLEITFLLIENYNDNTEEFENMCRFIQSLDSSIPFHISRAFPRYKLKMNVTPKSLLDKFSGIAKNYLKFVYIGNI